jgi:hypothetical protein
MLLVAEGARGAQSARVAMQTATDGVGANRTRCLSSVGPSLMFVGIILPFFPLYLSII